MRERSAPSAIHGEREAHGIKESTVGTTLYLLPAEHKRLKRLALDLDVSLHDLVLNGIDRILEENGLAPIVRYGGGR